VKWTSINNERRELYEERQEPFLRSTSSNSGKDFKTTDDHDEERQLKAKTPEYCDDFKFEFAIDGKVTTWDKTKYDEHYHHIQRVVEVIKVAEDPSITGGEEKEIEFAFRILNCGNEKSMRLTHLYWA
jgi:hypothetical protein